MSARTFVTIATLLACAFTTSAHMSCIPSEAEMGSNFLLGLKLAHGAPEAGTVAVTVTLPEGTYSVKPRPVYGFSLSRTLRELVPNVEVYGSMVNETVDTVTWTAVYGYEVPTWAVDIFEMYLSLPANQTGTMPFQVVQTLSDGELYEWIVGNSTMGPYNATAEVEEVDEHAGHVHRRRQAEEVYPAPVLTVIAPTADE
ncbi:hypothetical protein SARC_06766 [Sphaeroforma arctica JP610]|uniref:YncI copper-binding domain-containing protein n=1 Tax=Sphaeroforma arctica JP610 TaxID=667725 RepID=A0A0L0FW55_9EUKA|nr:hypothetical protein SARC_06766 [Sphaeroforma arctica JP610]KNC80884.1 hypothetical protein SARC_06766 [Sphaeroforma arctica JP610]|eukprot:XP_014154786.1 hypothetical protein SARC_06766 [Sphaeroforma arctica JP610]